MAYDPLLLQPGSLRASITIEAPSVSGDAFGSGGGTWDAILNTRASIQAISQRELTQDAQTVAQVSHVIKIRYPGATVAITAGCRVLSGTAVYNIQTVENVLNRNRVIKLLCVAIDASSLITNRTGDGTPVVSNAHPLTAADIPNIAESQVTGLVADLANLAANGGAVAQVNSDWDASTGAAQILNKPTLAAVAVSGSYADLNNKPTIPTAQINSDWNSGSGLSQILNKPTLATVATSGNYNDLTNKPASSTKRVSTQTAVTTININSDSYDVIYATITASSGTLTVNADTGTGQTEGRSILLKINCTNSMTFSFPTGTKGIYGGLVGLPVNTSGGGKTDIFSLYWDSVTSHWLFMGQGLGF